MNSPAHELSLLLTAALSETVYTASEPDTPDDVVTIYDTGGTGPDTNELSPIDATFQVRVRNTSYPNAYAKHMAVRDELIYTFPKVGATSTFWEIEATDEPFPLGRDDSNRFILVANYRCRRSEN